MCGCDLWSNTLPLDHEGAPKQLRDVITVASLKSQMASRIPVCYIRYDEFSIILYPVAG